MSAGNAAYRVPLHCFDQVLFCFAMKLNKQKIVMKIWEENVINFSEKNIEIYKKRIQGDFLIAYVVSKCKFDWKMSDKMSAINNLERKILM